jgi:hypothetical protein
MDSKMGFALTALVTPPITPEIVVKIAVAVWASCDMRSVTL